jgi:hypothetical protein
MYYESLPMKPLFGCIFLVSVAVHAQDASSPGLPKKYPNLYNQIFITTGGYSLAGFNPYPVAKFKYSYGTDPTLYQYADSMQVVKRQSSQALSVGWEVGNRHGLFFSTSFGGLLGTGGPPVASFRFASSLGYNFQTKITGLTIQTSVGVSSTSLATTLTSIPQNKTNIVLLSGETMKYKSNCGCITNETNVVAHNSVTAAQFRLALKYQLNQHLAVSAGVSYYAPVGSTFRVNVHNKWNETGVDYYTYRSAGGVSNDTSINKPMPIFGDVSLNINLEVRKPKRRSTGGRYGIHDNGDPYHSFHVHSSRCHH